MKSTEIKYTLIGMGYKYLLPHGPESLENGEARWHYTAYKSKEENALNQTMMFEIDSIEGEEAIEEYLNEGANIYLFNGTILVVNNQGAIVLNERMIKFKD